MSRRESLPDPGTVEEWDAVPASARDSGSFRGPIRLAAGVALALGLAYIVYRTLDERSVDAPEAYLGGLFFSSVAIGLALAVYIATRADD